MIASLYRYSLFFHTVALLKESHMPTHSKILPFIRNCYSCNRTYNVIEKYMYHEFIVFQMQANRLKILITENFKREGREYKLM